MPLFKIPKIFWWCYYLWLTAAKYSYSQKLFCRRRRRCLLRHRILWSEVLFSCMYYSYKYLRFLIYYYFWYILFIFLYLFLFFFSSLLLVVIILHNCCCMYINHRQKNPHWTKSLSKQSAATMICHNRNLLKWCIKCWLFLTSKFIIICVKWETTAAAKSSVREILIILFKFFHYIVLFCFFYVAGYKFVNINKNRYNGDLTYYKVTVIWIYSIKK